MPIGVRVAKTYKLIMQDALALDGDVSGKCTRDFTHALWYFLFGPLQDLYIYSHNALMKAALSGQMVVLRAWLIIAERIRRGDTRARLYLKTLHPRMGMAAHRISAASPLELLARLCWKRTNLVNLCESINLFLLTYVCLYFCHDGGSFFFY